MKPFSAWQWYGAARHVPSMEERAVPLCLIRYLYCREFP